MKIYISGKITGIESEAEALFQEAENLLLSKGHEVVNPLKIPHNHDKSWESYMKEDLKAMLDCDGIFMLDNYHNSRGAKIELKLAVDLGLKLVTK